MIDAGVDPFTAMDLVGHKTMSMAKRYAIRNTKADGSGAGPNAGILGAGVELGRHGQNADSEGQGGGDTLGKSRRSAHATVRSRLANLL